MSLLKNEKQVADMGPKLAAEAIFKGLSDKNPTYLRRRRLLDGTDNNALGYVAELTETIKEEIGEDEQLTFIASARAEATNLSTVVVLVAGWLALTYEDWETTETLGREIVSRDHHDLLAQRLIDAAREKSSSLETETDRWLRTRTCRAPFREMESRVNGEVHFCCSAWQPVPIGRLDDPKPDGFWNSKRALEIRRSVLDGDFSHCSRWHCPAIAGRKLPARETLLQNRSLRLEKGPERVILSHDRSCNISCPSCRTSLINLPHKETDQLNRVFEEHLFPLVKNARKIKVTGSGDPFGSRHFRHLLARLTATDSKIRRLQLHTNGLLANEKAWNDLDLWESVSSVWISIDAAKASTYSVLRRGGDFGILRENLRFLGALNASGKIDTLRFDFVVQTANFAEMPAFIDLAKEMDADGVYFLRLRNWGHVTPQEFRMQDICSPDHPQHAQLLKILSDDRFQSDAVDLGSVHSIR